MAKCLFWIPYWFPPFLFRCSKREAKKFCKTWNSWKQWVGLLQIFLYRKIFGCYLVFAWSEDPSLEWIWEENVILLFLQLTWRRRLSSNPDIRKRAKHRRQRHNRRNKWGLESTPPENNQIFVNWLLLIQWSKIKWFHLTYLNSKRHSSEFWTWSRINALLIHWIIQYLNTKDKLMLIVNQFQTYLDRTKNIAYLLSFFSVKHMEKSKKLNIWIFF